MATTRAWAEPPLSARPKRTFWSSILTWSLPGLALMGVLAYGAAGAGAASTTVTEKNNATFGTILADSAGKTLYTLTNNGSPVLCTGVCAQVWPPLTVPPGTKPTGPAGVCCLGTTTNANGEAVTYKGDPLYRYANDRSTSDATGDGVMSFGGTWHVVRVAASSSTSTTTTMATTTVPPTTAATTVPAPTTTAVTAPTSGPTQTPSSASAPSASLPTGSPGTGGTPPRGSGGYGIPLAVGMAALGLGGGAFWRLRRSRGEP